MTWLLGWNYRKKITVNGTTFGAQTNYPMVMVANKDVGTDTLGNIYLNNHCNDDFSDIIFTSSDGATILGYYIDSVNPGISATIWINVDTIPVSPGSSDIYIYYGNIGAITQSNPDNTFSFYDNGTGVDPTIKWQILAGSVAYYGYIYMSPSSMIVAKNPLPISFELIYYAPDSGYRSFPAIHDIKLSKETIQRNISRLYSTHPGAPGEGDSTFTPVIEGVTKPIIATIAGGDGAPTAIVTHILGGNWTTSLSSSQSQLSLRNASDTLYLHFTTPNSDEAIYIIRVRKYASPEPTFSVTGQQETVLGDVCIKSNPSGASITIDVIPQVGKITALSGGICNPENTVTGLTAGTDNHTYEIALTGYQSATNIFSIVAGMVTEIDIGNLVPLPGSLTINITPPDAVYNVIDSLGSIVASNVPSGTTVSNLTPGTYSSTLTRNGYEDKLLSNIVIGPGEPVILTDTLVPLPPSTGDVCIKSNPSGASITIDVTPYPKTTALSGTSCIPDNTITGLAPNSYPYEISLVGYQPKSGNFSITAGTLTQVEAGDLIPIPTTAGGGGFALLYLGLLFGLILGKKKCEDKHTKEECEKSGCQWKDGKCIERKQ